jgi:hypothetical protein
MISPPVSIFSGNQEIYVYGWREESGRFTPIVANPDGPGMGPWELYYGEDRWFIP